MKSRFIKLIAVTSLFGALLSLGATSAGAASCVQTTPSPYGMRTYFSGNSVTIDIEITSCYRVSPGSVEITNTGTGFRVFRSSPTNSMSRTVTGGSYNAFAYSFANLPAGNYNVYIAGFVQSANTKWVASQTIGSFRMVGSSSSTPTTTATVPRATTTVPVTTTVPRTTTTVPVTTTIPVTTTVPRTTTTVPRTTTTVPRTTTTLVTPPTLLTERLSASTVRGASARVTYTATLRCLSGCPEVLSARLCVPGNASSCITAQLLSKGTAIVRDYAGEFTLGSTPDGKARSVTLFPQVGQTAFQIPSLRSVIWIR